VVSFIKHLQRKLFHRSKPGLNLPTEQEIDPEGSNDGQTAVTHFLGKTREQIAEELATRLHWYFYEDFCYMGCKAFCFYFPAVADYVTTPEAKADYDVVTNFCHVIESRLKSDFAGIRESFPSVARFADYVSAHLGDFGYGPEEEADENLLERLRAIRLQCAEPGAPPNGGPAHGSGSSDGADGLPSVS
jgi:hypothetical protein